MKHECLDACISICRNGVNVEDINAGIGHINCRYPQGRHISLEASEYHNWKYNQHQNLDNIHQEQQRRNACLERDKGGQLARWVATATRLNIIRRQLCQRCANYVG